MSVLGWTHLLLAIAGLVTGFLVAVARKGTDYHRQMGWAYVGSMLALNITALMIYRLLGHFGPFHVAALFSLMTIAMGVIPVVRKKPRGRWLEIHAYWLAGSYVGLWAAAVAETTTRTDIFPFWWAVVGASLAVSGVGIWAVLTRVPRALKRIQR